jgi:hypothetical protein
VPTVTPGQLDSLGVGSSHVHGTHVLVVTHRFSSAQRRDRFSSRPRTSWTLLFSGRHRLLEGQR